MIESELYSLAHDAGCRAVETATVIPMVVNLHSDPFNDNSKIVKNWIVNDGVAGFAWITVRPANSKFANYLKKNGLGKTDSYSGGCKIWVSGYGQSMQKKEAYAQGFAKVLSDHGIRAYADSRMD